jgi:hypothetical protein
MLIFGTFLVFSAFILACVGQLISIWTGQEPAEGVLFLLVADLFRGQPFRMVVVDRDEMI